MVWLHPPPPPPRVSPVRAPLLLLSYHYACQLMKPSVDGLRPQDAHAAVCEFVRECVARGLPTECTVVDRQDVDVKRVQELAAELGASCRVRPYFP